MRITIKTTIMSLAAIGIFNGCSQQEVAMANTLANSTMASQSAGSNVGTSTVGNMLSSSAAQQGYAQSQVIGAQMMMNPAVIGVGAVGGAISAKNQAQNKAAFEKMTDLYVNSDSVNNSMEMKMVQIYNKKHGTNFKNMQELQDFAKIKGYNKQQGTNFTSFTEVREDYNKKNGTQYKTDNEFRKAVSRT